MKKVKKLLFIIPFILLGSISFAPTSFQCPYMRPSLCGLATNSLLVFGYVQNVKNETLNYILPGTKVVVEMDDLSTRNATITYIGKEGRNVKAGDRLKLICPKNESEVKYCELKFLEFNPTVSSCPPGSPCFGQTPSWHLQLENDGLPNRKIIIFD